MSDDEETQTSPQHQGQWVLGVRQAVHLDHTNSHSPLEDTNTNSDWSIVGMSISRLRSLYEVIALPMGYRRQRRITLGATMAIATALVGIIGWREVWASVRTWKASILVPLLKRF